MDSETYFMRNDKARFDIEADKDADMGRELPGEGTEAEYDEMCQRVLAGRRTRLAELRDCPSCSLPAEAREIIGIDAIRVDLMLEMLEDKK